VNIIERLAEIMDSFPNSINIGEEKEIPLCKNCPLNCHVAITYKNGRGVKYCRKWIMANYKSNKKKTS